MKSETRISREQQDVLFATLGKVIRYALLDGVPLENLLASMWLFLMTLQAREAGLDEDGISNISALRSEILDHIKPRR